MLNRNDVEKYLGCIRDIKKSYPLFDMHVHPFDVFGNGLTYSRNFQHDGLFSVNSCRYSPPALRRLRISPPESNGLLVAPDLKAKMAVLSARSLYAHTGARLFSDHMQLSGIDRILLLPVLGPDESDEPQMEMLSSMFGDDDRFALGCCIPNNVANNGIGAFVQNAVRDYKIRAIKIHPNITKIDLSSESGIERVEHILEAAGNSGLMVIVHGGRSTEVNDPKASTYGIARNLARVDWGITDQAVIVAHAGTYGHDLQEIKREVLPKMNKLLSRHANMFVDISGLEVGAVTSVVKSIDNDRIFFGSDALYNSQFGSVVKLLHVLKNNAGDHEEKFVKITSTNPAGCFSSN